MPQEQRRSGVALRWLRSAALLPLAAVTLSCAAPGRERDRPRVLLIDDGERVAHDDRALELPRGPDDPVWGVGQTARLFGLPGEVLALQVVVSAPDREPLTQVQVELPSLQRDPGGAAPALQPDPSPLLASDSAPERPAAIERFVVHDLSLSRRSGGRVPGESLGWAASAMPPLARADATVTSVPDVLIPLALAPPWADYPMSVAPGEHRVVWIDITLPDALPAGRYRGVVTACGLAGGMDLPASVAPFILRGVTLYGIDSVMAPLPVRRAAWDRLARDMDLARLDALTQDITLGEALEAAPRILAGQVRGRLVVDVNR